MKHRIMPLAILLLASFLYDALGLCVAMSAMVAAPPPVNGPLETLAIGQALPGEGPPPSMALPPVDLPPTVFPPDPSQINSPVPTPAFAIGSVPDLPPPSFVIPATALARDAVMAANTTQNCHSAFLPDQPTAAYQTATGLERIISHATTELTGLDATMASALVLDDTRAAFALRGAAARLAGISPEVVDPPG